MEETSKEEKISLQGRDLLNRKDKPTGKRPLKRKDKPTRKRPLKKKR
jgi:hypothetical protein